MAQLLYGTGMRLTECLQLRVKDVDFSSHIIVVRHGKGGKDRPTQDQHRAKGLAVASGVAGEDGQARRQHNQNAGQAHRHRDGRADHLGRRRVDGNPGNAV